MHCPALFREDLFNSDDYIELRMIKDHDAGFSFMRSLVSGTKMLIIIGIIVLSPLILSLPVSGLL